MATDRDVWHTARTLIDIHGEQAPRYALASVDLLIERGDLRLAADWRRVSAAAAALLGERPASPGSAH
jgi:hypothetical protein